MTPLVSPAVARLTAAFAEPGCPVCRCLDADARRDLAAFLREMTMDPAGRAALRAAGGFCGWHTSLLRDETDGILSVALLAEDLLRADLARRVVCSACVTLEERADAYLRGLLDLPATTLDGRGLPCRPHLRRLRAITPDVTRVTAMERALERRLARLQADLVGFIDKQDYRRTDPPTTQEARAWSDALEHLAGHPPLFGSDLARF